jgi:hypothetical protein
MRDAFGKTLRPQRWMQDNPAACARRRTQTGSGSLFGRAKLVLDETPKAVTSLSSLACRVVSVVAGSGVLPTAKGCSWIQRRTRCWGWGFIPARLTFAVEWRIEELKRELAAGGSCLRPFFATKPAFRALNLPTLYYRQITPGVYQQPGPVRTVVLSPGLALGKLNRRLPKLDAPPECLTLERAPFSATWFDCD